MNRRYPSLLYVFRWAVFTLLVGAAVGSLLGRTLEGLCVGLVLVLLHWARQLHRAQRWIAEPSEEPPEGFGVWGQLFDGIYLLQRRNREDRQRLESALDYLQDSLASMRDAAVIVDRRHNIAWSNDSADFLLGIKFPEDRGQPVLNLIRQPKFHQYFEMDAPDAPLRIDPTTEGERCLQFELSTFGEGDRLIFVRDVTQQYRLEQMRRDFVGNVSHELRTPLTVIKGYIDTLQNVPQFEEARFQRPLVQMNEQTARMENLLKDLLWLSRIESAETLRKTALTDVAQLVGETVNELCAAYADRDIRLTVDSGALVLGDRQELHSAFSNLIINALKYSDADQPVDVRWFEHEGRAVFSVLDRGMGIAKRHLPRLTERFYRVDKSRSQRIGGTGLGLAIVKHVATSHQAELTIDSELGRGSEFALSFEIAAQEADEVPIASGAISVSS